MITVKSLVFSLCDKYGDQTSVEFLITKLQPLLAASQNKVITQQKKLIKEAGFTPDTFFENEKEVIKARKKQVLLQVLRLADACGRLMEPKALYENIVLSRRRWREKKKIQRDCRRYEGGQPDRNMVKTPTGSSKRRLTKLSPLMLELINK